MRRGETPAGAVTPPVGRTAPESDLGPHRLGVSNRDRLRHEGGRRALQAGPGDRPGRAIVTGGWKRAPARARTRARIWRRPMSIGPGQPAHGLREVQAGPLSRRRLRHRPAERGFSLTGRGWHGRPIVGQVVRRKLTSRIRRDVVPPRGPPWSGSGAALAETAGGPAGGLGLPSSPFPASAPSDKTDSPPTDGKLVLAA